MQPSLSCSQSPLLVPLQHESNPHPPTYIPTYLHFFKPTNIIFTPICCCTMSTTAFRLYNQRLESISQISHIHNLSIPSSLFSSLLILLAQKHKLRSSLLCSFFKPIVSSSLLETHILLKTLFSDDLQSMYFFE